MDLHNKKKCASHGLSCTSSFFYFHCVCKQSVTPVTCVLMWGQNRMPASSTSVTQTWTFRHVISVWRQTLSAFDDDAFMFQNLIWPIPNVPSNTCWLTAESSGQKCNILKHVVVVNIKLKLYKNYSELQLLVSCLLKLFPKSFGGKQADVAGAWTWCGTTVPPDVSFHLKLRKVSPTKLL